jgi:hypothetical protein
VWGDSYVWGDGYVWGDATIAINQWVTQE